MPAHHFPAAPWPTALKVSSTLASLLLLGVGYGAVRVIPPAGLARGVGIAVACALPAVSLGSLLFVVRGYDVDATRLLVRRLLWSTVVPLHGLAEVVHDPAAIRRALRIFGNGGLFSLTGLYWTRALGRFRLFATDPACAVVLRLAGRTVVVTPRAPHVFVRHLGELFPRAHAEGRRDDQPSTPPV